MIKFFRHIRQKLLIENKASKYLLYAFGEIILVVIGILIALQINNWNESRKLENKVASIYAIVKSDLQLDMENIDYVLEAMLPEDTLLGIILEGRMTRELYENCDNCEFVVGGFPDITLRSRGLTLLEENSTIFDAQKDSLFIQISEFYSYYFTEIEVDMEEIEMDYSDNFAFWKTNKTWFADNIHSIKNDDFVQYALTDPDYINRVASWRRLYFQNYLSHLKEYKESALILIADLDKQTNQ
ncbi:DUF6090 family protein [Cryomorphaceae bacterium 1068]|nr:DUF6090 family protein [Cryomorphaceae bacterium 1068]